MKKKRTNSLWALLAALVLTLGLMGGASAAGKRVDIYLNGDILNIPSSFGAPFYDENSRLQIPMRYIIEACGYEVVWNGMEQSATIPTDGGNVVITLGSGMMETPGGSVAMNTGAMAKDGRTYIPLRYALEALAFKVEWKGGAYVDRVDITGTVGAAGKAVLSARQVAELASPAVFYIAVADEDVEFFATGSGFFIDQSGIAVTNYHVVEGASYAYILTSDGREFYLDKVLHYDIARDLAVITVGIFTEDGSQAAEAVKVPFLELADPKTIHNGDVCYAIGSPLGLQNSITGGLVSNANRMFSDSPYSFVQTSAPVSHGNSGGPLLNEYGEVIGVNSTMLADGQNLNFAIPVGDVASIKLDGLTGMELWDVMEKETVIKPPVNLRVVRQSGGSAFIQWDKVEGADCYHLYYQEVGEENYWYDGYDKPKDFYWYSDYSVEHSGLVKGKAYNIIVTAVKGGMESRDSKVLTFVATSGTVGGTTPPSNSNTPINPTKPEIEVYEDAAWAPDFGAICGAEPVSKGGGNGKYYYSYSIDDFDFVDVINYGNALNAEGYFWDEDISQPGMYYRNEDTGHWVMTKYSDYGSGYVITTE